MKSDIKIVFVGPRVEKFNIVNNDHARTHAKVSFFCSRSEISFLSKFGPKYENCQFKLKFDT